MSITRNNILILQLFHAAADYYNPIARDTGSSARLNDLMVSRLFGDPGCCGRPITSDRMRDVHATNRLQGRYAVIVVG